MLFVGMHCSNMGAANCSWENVLYTTDILAPMFTMFWIWKSSEIVQLSEVQYPKLCQLQ